MGLRSWSKKLRQQDYSLQWIISAGKESNDAAGTHLLELSLNDTIIQSELPVTKSVEEQSYVNEEFNNILGIDSDTVPGTVFRGLHTLTKPTASTEPNPNTLNLSSYYRLKVKNTGSAPVVITSLYSTLRKLYPGESLQDSTFPDNDTSAEDISDFQAIYETIADPTSINHILIAASELIEESFPSDLTAMFATLTSASTQEEIDTILSSTSFQNYYKNVYPRAFNIIQGRIGTIDGSGTFVVQTLPVTLEPNESVIFAITRQVSNYFYNPVDLG